MIRIGRPSSGSTQLLPRLPTSDGHTGAAGSGRSAPGVRCPPSCRRRADACYQKGAPTPAARKVLSILGSRPGGGHRTGGRGPARSRSALAWPLAARSAGWMRRACWPVLRRTLQGLGRLSDPSTFARVPEAPQSLMTRDRRSRPECSGLPAHRIACYAWRRPGSTGPDCPIRGRSCHAPAPGRWAPWAGDQRPGRAGSSLLANLAAAGRPGISSR
jgi:hypothetical protein